MVKLGRNISVLCVPVLLLSGIYSGLYTGTQVMNASPGGLSLGGIPEGYSDCTPGGIRGKVLMVRNWTSVWDAIRSTPGTSPPHLSSRAGREKYGACVGKRQTKSDQGRKASVESLSTPPSRAGRDAPGRKMSLVTFFFLSYR